MRNSHSYLRYNLYRKRVLTHYSHSMLHAPFTAAFLKLRSTIRAQLERDGPLPVEVLTPPDSRNASPMRSSSFARPRGNDIAARHKSKSPGRWRVIRAVSRATRSVAESVRPEAYSMWILLFLHC
jgi:hypothetical protein